MIFFFCFSGSLNVVNCLTNTQSKFFQLRVAFSLCFALWENSVHQQHFRRGVGFELTSFCSFSMCK